MPPKGKSKAQFQKQSYLGKYTLNCKTIRIAEEKLVAQEKKILALKEEFVAQEKEIARKTEDIEVRAKEFRRLNYELKEIRNVIDNKSRLVRHKKSKLNSLVVNESNQIQQIKTVHASIRSKTSFSVSNGKAQQRKRKPTTPDLPHMAKVIRRAETVQACTAIHGASPVNMEPVIEGIMDTLTSKFKSKNVADKILNSKSAVVNTINTTVVTKWTKDYFKSSENLLRSLNTYYSHCVMGKAKYINIRKANRKACYQKTKVPNFVTYATLSNYINNIDIGPLLNIEPTFTDGLPLDEIGSGMYRPCDVYLLRLAQFYLLTNEHRFDKLREFSCFQKKDPSSFMFVIALGGDGAPICGMSFLVSFLNVGNRIASSAENFMIFGSDVSENSKVVRKFVMKLMSDIKYLESTVFELSINDKNFKVEFKLGELPNDMKMLAFLAGELSNAAYYFSTFANVNQGDANNYKKKSWK